MPVFESLQRASSIFPFEPLQTPLSLLKVAFSFSSPTRARFRCGVAPRARVSMGVGKPRTHATARASRAGLLWLERKWLTPLPPAMHDCDVLLIIIQVIAMCIDCCGIAATVWFLVGIPGWQYVCRACARRQRALILCSSGLRCRGGQASMGVGN